MNRFSWGIFFLPFSSCKCWQCCWMKFHCNSKLPVLTKENWRRQKYILWINTTDFEERRKLLWTTNVKRFLLKLIETLENQFMGKGKQGRIKRKALREMREGDKKNVEENWNSSTTLCMGALLWLCNNYVVGIVNRLFNREIIHCKYHGIHALIRLRSTSI